LRFIPKSDETDIRIFQIAFQAKRRFAVRNGEIYVGQFAQSIFITDCIGPGSLACFYGLGINRIKDVYGVPDAPAPQGNALSADRPEMTFALVLTIGPIE
jgi:hypothetical protein